MKILVINGPNMQLLGRRKAEFYGTQTLPEIEAGLRAAADSLGVTIEEVTFYSYVRSSMMLLNCGVGEDS